MTKTTTTVFVPQYEYLCGTVAKHVAEWIDFHGSFNTYAEAEDYLSKWRNIPFRVPNPHLTGRYRIVERVITTIEIEVAIWEDSK